MMNEKNNIVFLENCFSSFSRKTSFKEKLKRKRKKMFEEGCTGVPTSVEDVSNCPQK